jgi:hypothetical protein
VVSAWSDGYWSPSQANFLLFCSVWTILALAYLVIVPGRFADLSHKYGIFAVELVTMIFWFAGWVALAVFLGDAGCSIWSDVCRAAEAATVFAAIEWCV